MSNTMQWVKAKPVFTEDCILITATEIRNEWNYHFYEIKKTDGEDEDGNPDWYWGIFCDDGEEWGDIEDLTAQLYFTMPLLPKGLELEGGAGMAEALGNKIVVSKWRRSWWRK